MARCREESGAAQTVPADATPANPSRNEIPADDSEPARPCARSPPLVSPLPFSSLSSLRELDWSPEDSACKAIARTCNPCASELPADRDPWIGVVRAEEARFHGHRQVAAERRTRSNNLLDKHRSDHQWQHVGGAVQRRRPAVLLCDDGSIAVRTAIGRARRGRDCTSRRGPPSRLPRGDARAPGCAERSSRLPP